MLSKCGVCGSNKSRFVKNQEVKGLLSSLGLENTLDKSTLLGDIFLSTKCTM